MNLKHVVPFVLFACTATIPTISLAAAPPTTTPEKTGAAAQSSSVLREASQLLDSIRISAAKAKTSATQLDVFATNPYIEWQAHGEELAAIRDDVNDMGRAAERLEALRPMAAPWQQQAIDRTVPLVKLMADNTHQAFAFLNDRQGDFWEPGYRKNVANLEVESGQLVQSMKEFEHYAKSRGEEMQLQQTLGIKSGV